MVVLVVGGEARRPARGAQLGSHAMAVTLCRMLGSVVVLWWRWWWRWWCGLLAARARLGKARALGEGGVAVRKGLRVPD